jgi:endo-1,3(4)-beta-glucanase
MLGDKALAQAGLLKLQKAFARFGSNKQSYPLVYECESFVEALFSVS